MKLREVLTPPLDDQLDGITHRMNVLMFKQKHIANGMNILLQQMDVDPNQHWVGHQAEGLIWVDNNWQAENTPENLILKAKYLILKAKSVKLRRKINALWARAQSLKKERP